MERFDQVTSTKIRYEVMGFSGMWARNFILPTVISLLVSGCFIDDPPPCTVQDDIAPESICSDLNRGPFTFKLDYTTANGQRPDGRYGYSASPGLSKQEAELECKSVLQYVFDTSQSYFNFEISEIQYYRGNICGEGFSLKSNLGDIRVKRVRKTGGNTYDYDLELTCVAD